VLSRWQGWVAALVATLVTGVLVILEVTDGGLRRWWAGHALTTDTVGGLLVLLITVLVADQVVRLRQIKGRARAVAAQAAIPVNQAIRSAQAVSQALSSPLTGGGMQRTSEPGRRAAVIPAKSTASEHSAC
jgi:hypothetical protein